MGEEGLGLEGEREGQRKREKEREGEILMCWRNINMLSPRCAPTRDGTHNLGYVPRLGIEQQHFGVWDAAPPTEPTWPRAFIYLFIYF